MSWKFKKGHLFAMDLFDAMKPVIILSQVLALMNFNFDRFNGFKRSGTLKFYWIVTFGWKIFCVLWTLFKTSEESFQWEIESFAHILDNFLSVVGVIFIGSVFIAINIKRLIKALTLVNQEFFIHHKTEAQKIYRFNIIVVIIHHLRFILILIFLIASRWKMNQHGAFKGFIHQIVRLSNEYFHIGMIAHYMAFVYVIYELFGVLAKRVKKANQVKRVVLWRRAHNIAMDYVEEFNYTNGVMVYMVVVSIFGEIVAHTPFIYKYRSMTYWTDVDWVILNACALFALIALPQFTVFRVSLSPFF